MEHVLHLFTPIKATITPNGGTLSPGDVATIDTNVPAVVLFTLDGSDPKLGAFGTRRGESPVEIELRVSTRVRFKAFDTRLGFSYNVSRTREAFFTVPRSNPAESFRSTEHFYNRLIRSVVDDNFYLTEGVWTVPVAGRPYTYVFVNREGFPIRLRVLHNGIDLFTNFPIVGTGQFIEVPIRPISGENTVVVQTQRAGVTALYDLGRYDIDVYA